MSLARAIRRRQVSGDGEGDEVVSASGGAETD